MARKRTIPPKVDNDTSYYLAVKKPKEFTADEVYIDALKIIKQYECISLKEVCCYTKCSPIRFNELIPPGSQEREQLEWAIQSVIGPKKQKLREKWEKSNNPLLQLGLYKLLATEDEREALSASSVYKPKGNEEQGQRKKGLDLSHLTDKEVDMFIELSKKIKPVGE